MLPPATLVFEEREKETKMRIFFEQSNKGIDLPLKGALRELFICTRIPHFLFRISDFRFHLSSRPAATPLQKSPLNPAATSRKVGKAGNMDSTHTQQSPGPGRPAPVWSSTWLGREGPKGGICRGHGRWSVGDSTDR